MGARVEFHGNLLFQYSDSVGNRRLSRTILPECPSTSDFGNGGMAGRHWAGALIKKSSPWSGPSRVRFTSGGLMRFGEDSDDRALFPEWAVKQLAIPKDAGDIAAEPPHAAIVSIRASGRWRSASDESTLFEYPGVAKGGLIHSMEYEFDEQVRLRIEGATAGSFELWLGEGDTVDVYSDDTASPTHGDLRRYRPPTASTRKDFDFAWLYSLFTGRPPAAPTIPEIPEKEFAILGALTPGVSTCFPGGGGGGGG